MVTVSQVGTVLDCSPVALDSAGSVVSLGVAAEGSAEGSVGADSLRPAVADAEGEPVGLDEGDVEGELLAVDSLGSSVGDEDLVGDVAGADEVADGVGVAVGVRVGFVVAVGVGVLVGVGLGAAPTGAATPGVRRAGPCCQTSATAPPSGTSRDVTAWLA
jgi:hypothetical protein